MRIIKLSFLLGLLIGVFYCGFHVGMMYNNVLYKQQLEKTQLQLDIISRSLNNIENKYHVYDCDLED